MFRNNSSCTTRHPYLICSLPRIQPGMKSWVHVQVQTMRRVRGHVMSVFMPRMGLQQYHYDPAEDQLIEVDNFHDAASSVDDAVDLDDLRGVDGDGDTSEGDDEYFHAADAELEQDMFQSMDLHNSSHEWLRGALADDGEEARVVQVIEVTENLEVVMVMPCYDSPSGSFESDARLRPEPERQQAARLNPFSFVRLKRVDFVDGPVICSCCDNPGCDRSVDARELFDFLFPVAQQ